MTEQLSVVDTLDDPLRDEIVRLWMAVNDADGAVGFSPGAPYDDVAAALGKHEQAMVAGNAWLLLARDDATGQLVGLGWWIRGEDGAPHIATIKRLQVHPARQGTGLGSRLMDHLHSPEVLALLEGVDFLHLQYRAGRGLGEWYQRWGYVDIVRKDLWRKNPDGSYGGWGEMLRTVDGSPLPPRQL